MSMMMTMALLLTPFKYQPILVDANAEGLEIPLDSELYEGEIVNNVVIGDTAADTPTVAPTDTAAPTSTKSN